MKDRTDISLDFQGHILGLEGALSRMVPEEQAHAFAETAGAILAKYVEDHAPEKRVEYLAELVEAMENEYNKFLDASI